MKEVIFVFSFTVPAEKEEAYQKMLAETLEITKDEDGTLLYEVFKDENGVYCQHERYADEAACVTHMQNTGAQLQQWFELTDINKSLPLEKSVMASKSNSSFKSITDASSTLKDSMRLL